MNVYVIVRDGDGFRVEVWRMEPGKALPLTPLPGTFPTREDAAAASAIVDRKLMPSEAQPGDHPDVAEIWC